MPSASPQRSKRSTRGPTPSSLQAEQTAEAIRQVEVYTSCAAQLTVRPESSGALAAWREGNADELREMEKIRKWMAERGIVLTDTTYTDLLARVTASRQMPRTSLRRQAIFATARVAFPPRSMS